MLLVGLTGGIASGKSTVDRILALHGLEVVDCDLIAHDVVRRGRWGFRRVVAAFGADAVLGPDGELDRGRVAALVFSDPAKRRLLNAATHFPVAVELLRRVVLAWLKCRLSLVVDMPLLFETGAHRAMGLRVLVLLDQEAQMQRLMARDSMGAAAALSRIQAQMPLEAKVPLADAIVDNRGSEERTREQAVALVHRIRVQSHSLLHLALSPPGMAVLLCAGVLALRALLLGTG